MSPCVTSTHALSALITSAQRPREAASACVHFRSQRKKFPTIAPGWSANEVSAIWYVCELSRASIGSTLNS